MKDDKKFILMYFTKSCPNKANILYDHDVLVIGKNEEGKQFLIERARELIKENVIADAQILELGEFIT